MNSKRIALPIIAFWALVCSLQLSPLIVPPGVDREIFRYVGMLIRHGGAPYRDVFDHKPPMIYVLTALTHGAGPYGFWVLETVFALAAAWCVYGLARRSRWPFPIFYALFFSSLYWNPEINQGGGLTRGFSACVSLGVLALLQNESRVAQVAVGALVAGVFSLQQEQVIGLLPFLWMALKNNSPESRRRILSRWAAGATAVVGGLALWLISHGAWSAFIHQAFGFNLKIYSSVTPPIGRWPLGFRAYQPFIAVTVAALILSIAFYPRTSEIRQQNGCAWVSIIALHFSTVLASGHWFNHYALGGLPYWIVLFGSIIAGISMRKVWAAIPGCLCLMFLFPHEPLAVFAGRVRGVITHRRSSVYQQTFGALSGYLGAVRGQPGQLFVFRFPAALSLNVDYDILAPSPWVFTTFWDSYPQWDRDGSIFQTIIDSLERNRTRYVMDGSPVEPIRSPLQEKWQAYIAAHYQLLTHSPSGAVLYERVK